MTRLLDCLQWLGALTLRELARALQRTILTVRRLLTRAAKGRVEVDGVGFRRRVSDVRAWRAP